jgi:phage gp36-like protein
MYAVLADILDQIDEATLIALSDDELNGAVDATVVERALTNAGALIDVHCGDRYTVPFAAPVPDLIRLFAVDLAIYNLYSRRPHIEMPESIGERQKQVLVYLRRVQEGKAGIGIAPSTAASGDESNSALVSGNERIFTRKTMRGL